MLERWFLQGIALIPNPNPNPNPKPNSHPTRLLDCRFLQDVAYLQGEMDAMITAVQVRVRVRVRARWM